MKSVPDKKIFISYRVQDTAGETGRMVDALKQYFTDDQLFMDIENLEPGADFTEAIERSLSACDVFLAVIGPRWTGPRDGQPSRINDEADWVRLEVGTALRRNVRVVPVLVDGGILPKAEDLPPDLQPLLRRQTIEVSNKRWRYDTDQLAQFLIQTVGIVPRRAAVRQKQQAPPPKKSKTWLYVAGGFVLAVVVLALIGSMMSEEKKNADNNLPVNDPQQTTSAPSSETDHVLSATSTTANVSGTWQEVDEGITTTLYFSQNGNTVNVQTQMAGQATGVGSGTVNGHDVDLNVNLLGVATNLRGTVSEDGNIINGTYTVPATGVSQPFKLVKK